MPDGAHAASQFTAEFTDAFFTIPFGDICLFIVRLDADIDILSAKVLLDGFCYQVAVFSG